MRHGTTLNDLMQWDNTLFDNIILNAEIDKETLISTIKNYYDFSSDSWK